MIDRDNDYDDDVDYDYRETMMIDRDNLSIDVDDVVYGVVTYH
jgi:hypothetical protein